MSREATARVVDIAENAKPLAANGGDRKTEPHQYNNYNTDIPSIQGTDPAYLTARIARDRPDILERMKAGEVMCTHKSASRMAYLLISPNYEKEFRGMTRGKLERNLKFSSRSVADAIFVPRTAVRHLWRRCICARIMSPTTSNCGSAP